MEINRLKEIAKIEKHMLFEKQHSHFCCYLTPIILFDPLRFDIIQGITEHI